MPERSQNSLLICGNFASQGETVSIAPDGETWRYINFSILRLHAGQSRRAHTETAEVVLVMIAGTVDVGSSEGAWRHIGSRKDPFSGPPCALYLPSGTRYEITADSSAEIAVCAAPGGHHFPARLIQLTDADGYIRGEGQARRRIFNILMDDGAANSLFLTEVLTLPGNWSSFPPHKHDEDNPPDESQLEELYYYRANPSEGFAFQRIYTASGDLDETLTAHDGDVVLVPRGYHVCAAAPEYWIYYLNVLAGPKHVYRMTFDPAYAWIKKNWKW